MKQTKNNVLSLLGIIAGIFAMAFVTVSCTPEVKAQEPEPVPTTYTVTYITEHDSAPTTIEVEENTILSAEQLPELSEKDFVFKGWYEGDVKAVPGEYEVKGNVKLTARWNMIKHAIKKISSTQTTNGSSYVNIQEYENNSKGQIAKLTTTTTSNGTESVSESTYEYNDNGSIVKTTIISDSGTAGSETEYNDHGDIVKITTINNGEIIYVQNTEYDSNYYLIKSTMTYTGMDYSFVTEYENNSKGQPVKTTQTITLNGKETVTVTVNEYNAHGDVVKKTSFSNDKIISTYIYEYDSNYYLTKETTYSGEEFDDKNNVVTEYENNSNGQPLTVTKTTTSNGTKSVSVTAYVYDADGKTTKCTQTNPISGTDYIIVTDYEYNEHGDRTKITNYMNGEIISMSSYEYEDIEI